MFSRRLAVGLVLSATVSSVTVAADFLYPQPIIGLGDEPVGLLAIDIDGDGLLDLISTNTDSGDVRVMLGNGDGTFATATGFEACGGPFAGGPAYSTPGDFDENGMTDLAVTCRFSGLVAILLGNGDGTFGPSTEYGLPDEDPYLSEVGDFNGDDHLDLMVANPYNTGSVTMHLGNGDGSLGPEIMVDDGWPCFSVAVGDFNEDDLDDFVRSRNGNLEVHLGNGDGTFAPPLLSPGTGVHIVPVDLNDDQHLDLVTARGYTASEVLVLLGNGDGTFGAAQAYPTGDNNPNFVAVADFNGDQILDLAVNNRDAETASLSVLLGTGGGQFAPAVGFDPTRLGADSIALGDFDRDGAADVVRPCFWCDDANILFGDGAGGFRTSLREDVGESPSDVVAADLDGDGRPDLATTNEDTDDVSVLLADAAGTFEPEVRYPTRRGPSAIVAGEFTGDTLPDLVATNRAQDVLSLLTGTGGGGFSSSIGPFVGTGPSDLAVGDFDEDDQDDLAVANEGSNNVSVLLGLGNGQFSTQPIVPAGTGPVSIAVADFDSDGHDDLAVANGGSNDVSVLLGTGSGAFVAAASIGVGSLPTALGAGDIDGDDNPDLAVVHEGSDDLRIYLGNGSGSFTAGQVFPIEFPHNPRSVVVTDVNDDGLLDVAVGASLRLDVFVNTGGGILAHEAGYAARVANGIAGADVNGDALLDLMASGDNHDVVTIHLNQSGPDALSLGADKSRVVWPAVIGALSYNVYRGDVGSLVDGDDDGLPDGGYGTCMTALDPDPTDTFFDDPEMPLAGGFFYLRSVIGGGGDQGLGTTSGGLPRMPATPCP